MTIRASQHIAPTAGPAVDDRMAMAAKLALRRMASTVSVITCRAGDGCHAMTATAVSALSMAPPSMLVCVNRSSSFHGPIAGATFFAINVLSRGQSEISRACGGGSGGEERFRIGAWDMAGPAPVLAGAQATIICRKAEVSQFGTHAIVIGTIVSATANGEPDPLVYCDGSYVERPVTGAAGKD